MHPFTSLTLWALAAWLLLPAGVPLSLYSAATFVGLLCMKATRSRAKYVLWLMIPLDWGYGWYTADGTEWISGQPRAPERWADAVTLWLRIPPLCRHRRCGCSTCRLRALCAPCLFHACRRALPICSQARCWWLNSSNANWRLFHEAQRARGVPLDESGTNVYALCRH